MTTPREVTDDEGTSWSCVQAFAGLSDGDAAQEAAERAAQVRRLRDLAGVGE